MPVRMPAENTPQTSWSSHTLFFGKSRDAALVLSDLTRYFSTYLNNSVTLSFLSAQLHVHAYLGAKIKGHEKNNLSLYKQR